MARRPRQQTARIQTFATVAKPLVDTTQASSKKRKQPAELVDDFPVDLKKRRFAVVITPETPSKACNRAFAKLSIDVTASNPHGAKRKRDLNSKTDIGISPSSGSSTAVIDAGEPQPELQSLERLFAALLSALTLHHAHNGVSSSVDLRTLTPSITKIWGVRKVVLLDIQHLLGVLQYQKSGKQLFSNIFSLRDFGGGKVCIEIKQTTKRKASGYLFDEAQLKKTFKDSLNNIWTSYCNDSRPDQSSDSPCFLDQLPLAALVASSSNRKVAALHTKGQRRLEEVLTPFRKITLNDDLADRPIKRSKTESDTPSNRKQQAQSPGAENVPPQTTADRSQSLLERIKAKEALAAAMPAGPTKEERERLAALQRSQDFLTILNLLAVAKGGSRVSFPLPTLISNIQSSIRSPMAKDEILRCIKLLQTEIAPGYISLVTFGSITGVVVDVSRKPSAGEIAEKLRSKGVSV
jgi:hypothetical protein